MIAADGREAVDWMDREAFDLVLMDVQMPVLDGLQATRIIRQREQAKGSRTPIIALTAHALESDRRLCLDAGMDEHLAKPVRRKQLLELIDSLTGESLSLDAAKSSPKEKQPPALIDWDIAMEAVHGNRDLMRELVEIYLQEGPKLLDELQRAVAQGDAPRVRIVAHTLKGSTRYFGDLEPARIALRLEEQGKTEDLAQSPESLRLLRASLDALFVELRRYLRQANI